MKLGVVGLGLLGGSTALALRQLYGSDLTVMGSDKSADNGAQAKKLGIVDQLLDLDQLVKESQDVLLLATPVDTLADLAVYALDHCNRDTLVVDVGSTKAGICRAVADHPRREQFLAAHPIAGTENSGPEAAFTGLLRYKTMIFCETKRTRQPLYRMARHLFSGLDMHLAVMESAEEHDLHLAYVSHLSHVSSFALGSTVLDKERDERSIFHMAGSGFSSTVRLAKSSPDMWAPIFLKNKENVSQALNSYIEKLVYFKSILDQDDRQALHEFMAHANDIRRVLQGIDSKTQK